MNILIVEDSDLKIRELEDFFSKSISTKVEYEISKTFRESAIKIVDGDYGLVILDMTLPVKSGGGGKVRALAGRDILGLIKYNDLKNIRVIIFSQFSEFGSKENVVTLNDIYEGFKDDYPDYILGCVQFSGTSDVWKKELKRMLKELKVQ